MDIKRIVCENKLNPGISVKPGDSVQVLWNRVYTLAGRVLKREEKEVAFYEVDESFVAHYAGVFEIDSGGYGGYFSTESQMGE